MADKRAIAVRVTFVILAALLSIYALVLSVVALRAPFYGFSFLPAPEGISVVEVVDGGIAERAGLMERDLIFEVDGVSLEGLSDPLIVKVMGVRGLGAIELFSAKEPGDKLSLSVLRGGKAMALETEVISLPAPRFLWDVVARFSLGFILLCMAVFLSLQKPDAKPVIVFSIAFLFAAASALNGAMRSVILGEEGVMIHWALVVLSKAVVGPLALWCYTSAFLHFSLIFPEERRVVKRHPGIVYGIYLIAPLVSLSAGLASRSDFVFSLLRYSVPITYMFLMLGNFVRSYVVARSGVVRNQLKWLIWGLAVSSIPFLAPSHALSALGAHLHLPPGTSSFATLIFAAAVFFSIFKYKLFAIDVVINRTIVYFLLTILIVALYMGLVTALGRIFLAIMGTESHAASIISTLIIAALFVPLRDRIQHFVDRAFYREKYSYKRIIAELSREMVSLLDLDAIVKGLVDTLVGAMHASAAAVLISKDESGPFKVYAAEGESAGDIREIELPRDGALIDIMSRRGREVFRYALAEARGSLEEEALRQMDRLRAVLALPILFKGRLIGILALADKRSKDLYTVEDLELLHTLVNQSAIAIENARTYISASDMVKKLSTLYHIGAAIRSNLDLGSLLDLTLVSLVKNLYYDRAIVMLYDEERGVLNRGQCIGGDPETIDLIRGLEIPVEEDGGVFSRAVLRRRPILVGDASDDDLKSDGGIWDALKTRSLLVVPLKIKDSVIGVLAVDNFLSRRSLGDEDVKLLMTLAGQVAISIENARIVDSLNRSRAELERSHEQLLQAEKLSLLGQLSASVAHEVRNPLNNIMGAVENLALDSTDREREEALQIIRKEVDRANRFLTEFVNFSRPLPPRKSPVDVNSFVEGALMLVRYTVRKGRIRVDERFARGLPPVPMDEGQMKQVLINIVLNAVKSMESSPEKRLTISTFQEDGLVGISIGDTGCGMEERELKKIFKPFYFKGEGGTGLGLAVSWDIVRNHSGRIEVSSAPGKGTTFTVWLPISDKA
ncbi:MAG: GAF domain-containing protein [bacterium]